MDYALWWGSTVAEAVCAVALVYRGLAGKFPAFFTLMAFSAAGSAFIALFSQYGSVKNGVLWAILQAGLIALWILASVELFGRICEHYPGIGSLSRTVMLVALAFAFLGCLLAPHADLGAVDWGRSLVRMFVLLDRWVLTVLAVFLVATAAFFGFCGARLRPNVLRHGIILGSYFAVHVVTMFLANALRAVHGHGEGVGSPALTILNRSMLAGSMFCAIAWCFALTRHGEATPEEEPLSETEIRWIQARDRELLDVLKTLRS